MKHDDLTAKLDDVVNMGDMEKVRRLVGQGADVNGRNILGDTPLMAAAHTGGADMVRLLLSYGADMTMKNAHGKTAYEIASTLDHQEVLSAFREHEMP